MAKRRCDRPTRHRIVRDVEYAAHRQVTSGNLNNHAAIFFSNPAPDAMHRVHVERRQIGSGGELLERIIQYRDIRPRGDRQLSGVPGLRRIEVATPELATGRRSVDVETDALPEAKLQISKLVRPTVLHAFAQQ